jgi:hypothetical protein
MCQLLVLSSHIKSEIGALGAKELTTFSAGNLPKRTVVFLLPQSESQNGAFWKCRNVDISKLQQPKLTHIHLKLIYHKVANPCRI